MVKNCCHHGKITSCPLAPCSPLHAFSFFLSFCQKKYKNQQKQLYLVSRNRCMIISTAVRILLMTPLLSCCVLLNGPSKSSACWNIRAILLRSLCLLCPHFSKKGFRNKKVLLAIRKITVPISSWESCCLVGRKEPLHPSVLAESHLTQSVYCPQGFLWDMTSALWAVTDP